MCDLCRKKGIWKIDYYIWRRGKTSFFLLNRYVYCVKPVLFHPKTWNIQILPTNTLVHSRLLSDERRKKTKCSEWKWYSGQTTSCGENRSLAVYKRTSASAQTQWQREQFNVIRYHTSTDRLNPWHLAKETNRRQRRTHVQQINSVNGFFFSRHH